MNQLNELTRFRYGQSATAMDFLPATFYVGAKAHPNAWLSAVPRDNLNLNLVVGLNWAFRRPKPKAAEVLE